MELNIQKMYCSGDVFGITNVSCMKCNLNYCLCTAYILGKYLGDFLWVAGPRLVGVSKVPLRAIKVQAFLVLFRLEAC